MKILQAAGEWVLLSRPRETEVKAGALFLPGSTSAASYEVISVGDAVDFHVEEGCIAFVADSKLLHTLPLGTEEFKLAHKTNIMCFLTEEGE